MAMNFPFKIAFSVSFVLLCFHFHLSQDVF